jgi:hypothetical protein
MNDDMVEPDALDAADGASPEPAPAAVRRRRARRLRRPPWWMFVLTAIGLVAIVVAITLPTSKQIDLRVGDIPAAVAAVEQRLGGPQRYSEINAAKEGVNVFVVVDDAHEQTWFFNGHTLQGPGEVEPTEDHKPFTLESVKLDVAATLARSVLDRFPGATLIQLALIRPDEGVIWAVRTRGSLGGIAETFFNTDGQPIGGALK